MMLKMVTRIWCTCMGLVIVSLLVGQARYASVISFAASSGGDDYHMFLMDVWLHRTRQLSDQTIYCCPVWSPDGQHIIFIHQSTNLHKRLYMMNAYGGQFRALTAASAPDTLTAEWSPDGNFIVYTLLPLRQDQEIAVLDVQAGTTNQLTHNTHDDDSPQWSPDGRFIVFKSRADHGQWNIFRMNPDGAAVQQLTDAQGSDLFPRISPDSRRIAFVSENAGNQDLFVMNADGSDRQQLTWTPTLEMTPFWSADGRQILFQSQQRGTGSSSLYMVDADGRNLRQLMHSTVSSLSSASFWSPNGNHILFLSKSATDAADVYMMDADGSQVRRLTHQAERHTYPAWHPG